MPAYSDNPKNQIQENNSSTAKSNENEYRLPREADAFIPIEEWSKVQETNRYEPQQEAEAFISVDKWANPEINKKEEVSIAKDTGNTLETIAFKFENAKNCRFCHNEIKSDAVKCDHCGRMLTERTAKRIFL